MYRAVAGFFSTTCEGLALGESARLSRAGFPFTVVEPPLLSFPSPGKCTLVVDGWGVMGLLWLAGAAGGTVVAEAADGVDADAEVVFGIVGVACGLGAEAGGCGKGCVGAPNAGPRF